MTEKTIRAASEDVIYGDNSDKKINILDMILLKSYVNKENPKGFSISAADLDGDGEVSARDAAELSWYLLNQVGTFSYEIDIDSDEDGLCDYIEKELLKTDYLKKDTDGDGLLDGDDENQWGWSIRDPEPTVYNNFIPFGTEAYFDDLEKTNPLNPDTIYLYMMKQVNSAEYYDLIPFEYWDAFCEYFNDKIKGVKIDEDLHYFRVKLNRAPESLDDMMKIDERKNWTLLEPSMSIYHMFNTKACYDEKEGKYKGEYNLKFVSHDGKYEAVYNYAGVLLDENNDPVNMGTYNYSDPNATLAVGHVIVDLFPYTNELRYQLISQLLGNSTTGLGNVPGTYIDCSSANTNFDRYADNLDAQEHYAKYK